MSKRWTKEEVEFIESNKFCSLDKLSILLFLFGFEKTPTQICNKLCWLDGQHILEIERTRVYNDECTEFEDLLDNYKNLPWA